MYIIKNRVKYQKNTIGYLLYDNSTDTVFFVNSENIFKYNIENAYRLSNGEYRAKNNYEIQNIDYSQLSLNIGNRRTDRVGKPLILSVSTEGRLSLTQKKLLEKFKVKDKVYINRHTDKIKVDMVDLSCMTSVTKVEYSLFERPDSYIIYKGTDRGIHISNDDYIKLLNGRYKWVGHTHVGYDFFCLQGSDGDYETLKKMHQKQSVIFNCVGQYNIISLDGE